MGRVRPRLALGLEKATSQPEPCFFVGPVSQVLENKSVISASAAPAVTSHSPSLLGSVPFAKKEILRVITDPLPPPSESWDFRCVATACLLGS